MCLLLTGPFSSAPGSFIYSLRNNDDIAPFKSTLKNDSDPLAIIRYHSYGPTFSGHHPDLIIANNAASNINSHTDFGYRYNLPPGYTYGQTNTRSLLAGSFRFTPSEVEVLYLN